MYLMGYGFPVHRGGPMFYADTVRLYDVVQRMRQFAAHPHGDPAFWTPAPLLARLAAEDGSFNASAGVRDERAEAVIVSTARTPLGKSWRGAFNMSHGAVLGGHVVHAAIERAKLDPAKSRTSSWAAGCPRARPAATSRGIIANAAGCPVTCRA